jgi:hypothetical protein
MVTRQLGSLMALFVSVVVATNILWYWIKGLNWSRGYRADFIWHTRDLSNFAEIIRNEKNPRSQRRYRCILWMTYAGITTVLIIFVLMVLTLWSSTPGR